MQSMTGFEKIRGGVTSHRWGFTLAEVLITLGIIGVVAALTIPTLVNNYQKKVYVTKLQKAISVLNNGFKLMMANEGVNYINQTELYSCRANMGLVGPNESERACIYSHLSKYFKIVDYTKTTDHSAAGEVYYPFGSIQTLSGRTWSKLASMAYTSATFSFKSPDNIVYHLGFSYAMNLIDVNGSSGPNQIGRDIFFLKMDRETGAFTTYGNDTWDNESNTNDYCGDNITNQAGYGCAARIMAEGWKMNY